jgi:uncharacterized membrane protein (UPF0127 family)
MGGPEGAPPKGAKPELTAMPHPHFLNPLLREDPAAFEFRNGRNGQLVARHLITAFDSRSRRQGLLGRDELPHFTALVIGPCNAVHTCFMRFAIDVIFTDRSGFVLRVAHDVKPWRIQIRPHAFVTVELPAGAARRADLRAGDRLMLAPAGLAKEISRPVAARWPSAESPSA